MSASFIVLIVLALGSVGFFFASTRARFIESKGTKMHSRPQYYGWWTFLVTIIPSLIVLAIWDIGSAVYIEHRASARLDEKVAEGHYLNHSLALGTIRNLTQAFALTKTPSVNISHDSDTASLLYDTIREEMAQKGIMLPTEGADYLVPIALEWQERSHFFRLWSAGITLSLAAIGFISAIIQIAPRKRARNKVEKMVTWALMIASTVAILTTIGIVFSMLFQTISFFNSVPLSNFFLGTVWDPRFASAGSGGEVGQFGLLPLLAGTLYIALIAMLFAVPVGLFAAIYMAEYASSRMRSIIKPLLEVLAGIPTIVYGFFALMTIGPFLRDLSIAIAGGQGFIMAQSVLTAGLVMGIMLIPFVSSLSDDIITAVPQTLRDGSYGLGATQSETVKKVILPAALPGIVGAVLLTASRAIGETMIVVLAAGVAANLTINPFEAMTTITVKIVNQLTGDLEFNSPQTLVAFALGMTLFVLTLLMNIFALYIVNKYREQYD